MDTSLLAAADEPELDAGEQSALLIDEDRFLSSDDDDEGPPSPSAKTYKRMTPDQMTSRLAEITLWCNARREMLLKHVKRSAKAVRAMARSDAATVAARKELHAARKAIEQANAVSEGNARGVASAIDKMRTEYTASLERVEAKLAKTAAVERRALSAKLEAQVEARLAKDMPSRSALEAHDARMEEHSKEMREQTAFNEMRTETVARTLLARARQLGSDLDNFLGLEEGCPGSAQSLAEEGMAVHAALLDLHQTKHHALATISASLEIQGRSLDARHTNNTTHIQSVLAAFNERNKKVHDCVQAQQKLLADTIQTFETRFEILTQACVPGKKMGAFYGGLDEPGPPKWTAEPPHAFSGATVPA